MPSPPIIEHKDYYDLPLAELRVTQLVVDFSFTLRFDSDSGHNYADELRLYSAFRIESGGDTWSLDPEGNREALGPALRLFNQIVVSATATRHGALSLSFGDGASLTAIADPQYEAWHLLWGNRGFAVCMPGGNLAIWQPQDQPDAVRLRVLEALLKTLRGNRSIVRRPHSCQWQTFPSLDVDPLLDYLATDHPSVSAALAEAQRKMNRYNVVAEAANFQGTTSEHQAQILHNRAAQVAPALEDAIQAVESLLRL